MQEASTWVIEETKTANFGDKRLNKRYGSLLNSFATNPTKSIPGSFKSWGETIAAYRFLNNENVTVPQILSPHKEATLKRIKNEKVVIIPQDTTDIDFSTRNTLSGMGHLTNEKSKGFYLHPSIAFTPERCCLGIVGAEIWIREALGTRFETNEWQSVYAIVTKKTPPKEPPKLNEIILMIAKLGGFLGRKSDGYPGPKVMWIGIQRAKDFTLAWETFRWHDR